MINKRAEHITFLRKLLFILRIHFQPGKSLSRNVIIVRNKYYYYTFGIACQQTYPETSGSKIRNDQ